MSPQRKIATFLFLTLAFSMVSYVPIIRAGTAGVADGIFVLTLMWSPGMAAILTQLIANHSLRGLGWRFGSIRWLGLGYVLPILYALPVYAFAWLTGIGFFINPYNVSELTRQYASPSLASALPVFIVLNSTVGLVQSIIMALGEENGWRGLFVPELAKTTSFTKAALISGVVWAAWHMPIVLFADYSSGAPIAYAAACFIVMIVGESFAYAFLRLKSGSVWPAVLLHAVHNTFIQGVFDRMTGASAITPYIIGEFGIGLAITGLIVAYLFSRLEHDSSVQTQLLRIPAAVQPR